MVSFVVNEEGGVEDVVVDQPIGGGCDEEAMRVVGEARFTPGREVDPSPVGNVYGETSQGADISIGHMPTVPV